MFKNLVLIGNNSLEKTDGPDGATKVYSAQTGKLLWKYDASPAPGEFGYETWLNGQRVTSLLPLGYGDELQVGQVRLRLERAGSA